MAQNSITGGVGNIAQVAGGVYAMMLHETKGDRDDWMTIDFVRFCVYRTQGVKPSAEEVNAVISYLIDTDVMIESRQYSAEGDQKMYVARTIYEIANKIYRKPNFLKFQLRSKSAEATPE